jgi:hypothetical protein
MNLRLKFTGTWMFRGMFQRASSRAAMIHQARAPSMLPFSHFELYFWRAVGACCCTLRVLLALRVLRVLHVLRVLLALRVLRVLHVLHVLRVLLLGRVLRVLLCCLCECTHAHPFCLHKLSMNNVACVCEWNNKRGTCLACFVAKS